MLPPLRYAFDPVESRGKSVALNAPETPKMRVHNGIPIMNNPRFVRDCALVKQTSFNP